MADIDFYKIWNYSLFKIGNNEIMASNIVIASIMLWLGLKYYKTLVAKLNLFVAHYVKDDAATALVLQRIISYVMVFIYGVFVLDLANIPTSIFAFLGGTIALSVGLGAQALMGNFLSGLLIVLEKSLKTGDIVEIDGVVGEVESMGIRSTTIRTFCDSYIVIPNSNFIHSIFAKPKTHKNFIERKASIEIEIGNQSEAQIREDILQTIDSVDFITKNPKTTIYLTEIHNKKFLYSVYFYCKISEQYRMEYVTDQINKAIREKLHGYVFNITYPYKYKITKDR
jgi:small-conductance mechanosensitive channel